MNLDIIYSWEHLWQESLHWDKLDGEERPHYKGSCQRNWLGNLVSYSQAPWGSFLFLFILQLWSLSHLYFISPPPSSHIFLAFSFSPPVSLSSLTFLCLFSLLSFFSLSHLSFLAFILKDEYKLNNYFSVVHYAILAFWSFLLLIATNKKIVSFYENIDAETSKHFLQIIQRKYLVCWREVIHLPDL